ncbi:MAG: sugar phosphate isomerase/epimerase [Chloroflexi bacterium]|nr:sugar phosphate isomerase/epimerase [Chloroflexota bacterium]
MKLCYALRRGVFYPSTQDLFGTMPPKEHRAGYLKVVKSYGFDGVEIPAASQQEIEAGAAKAFGQELKDAGLPALCVRAGGPIAHHTAGADARERLERAIKLAAALGATVVNTTFVTPATNPGGLGSDRRGEVISQGSSRQASEADFEATAKQLRHYGKMAADHGLDISIEVHQGSIADNSTTTLHLLDLVGLDNVGANPDLGNVLWHYEFPEETSEQAIVALAPRSTYWHCKNLRRLHIPELNKSWYIRVPLDDGDIDYRFAISAMVDAGYSGYLAVEGAQVGDQLTLDRRSVDYVRGILAELGQ